ncbi:hypothetical protein PDE_07813 [Penicillium oxalicum 114-2]|uniref:Protein kinase domain-containing protein n=1 Tax=Penicillium oxalicum (strain 114-2 / CGMCC 5302) TaxID=933388 RepID=S8BD33_PENO1|nr:hypothetical protein PDE_07813 [Penicillium oxalicum 114-2]
MFRLKQACYGRFSLSLATARLPSFRARKILSMWLCRDLLDLRNRDLQPSRNNRIRPCSLDQLTPLLPDGVMSSVMVRTTIRNTLPALDFLHTEANVIHTDLQPNNILLGIKDDSVLSQSGQAKFEAPVPRKILEDRTVYLSRPLRISYGTPVLCDLGEARLGTDQQQGDILPDIYRAPEVILNMSWDSNVDIWNVGMLIWDPFENRHLFRARNSARELDDGYHLARCKRSSEVLLLSFSFGTKGASCFGTKMKKGSKPMQRMTCYVFSDEWYVGLQKKEPL